MMYVFVRDVSRRRVALHGRRSTPPGVNLRGVPATYQRREYGILSDRTQVIAVHPECG